jgi:hypothetical protein
VDDLRPLSPDETTPLAGRESGSFSFHQVLLNSMDTTFRLLRDNLVMQDVIREELDNNVLKTHGGCILVWV